MIVLTKTIKLFIIKLVKKEIIDINIMQQLDTWI